MQRAQRLSGESLQGRRIGLEREALRIEPDGRLAQTSHPAALGSALTNARITTDYAEGLLEFVTPPVANAFEAWNALDDILRFAYSHIGDELLWPSSVPCPLEGEEIHEGWYGSSNVGLSKHIYRLGLSHRYGSMMQMLAGVHFNFSLPASAWSEIDGKSSSIKGSAAANDEVSERFLGLARNALRHGWLVLYLTGASPVLCPSYIKGSFTRAQHRLIEMFPGSFGRPLSTSLRMSSIGYRNTPLGGDSAPLQVSMNTIPAYVRSMLRALRSPCLPFGEARLGGSARYRQLSGACLQIENEYYSPVRIKSSPQSGEMFLKSLVERGVSHVELRLLDVDPTDPAGISLPVLRFLEAFMLFCALGDSPQLTESELKEADVNLLAVAESGRDPRTTLVTGGSRRPLPLKAAAAPLMEGIALACEALDRDGGGDDYAQAWTLMDERVQEAEKTPSAQLCQHLQASAIGFRDYAMKRALHWREFYLKQPLPAEKQAEFVSWARLSLERQTQVEEEQASQPFPDFLDQYYSQLEKVDRYLERHRQE